MHGSCMGLVLASCTGCFHLASQTQHPRLGFPVRLRRLALLPMRPHVVQVLLRRLGLPMLHSLLSFLATSRPWITSSLGQPLW